MDPKPPAVHWRKASPRSLLRFAYFPQDFKNKLEFGKQHLSYKSYSQFLPSRSYFPDITRKR